MEKAWSRCRDAVCCAGPESPRRHWWAMGPLSPAFAAPAQVAVLGGGMAGLTAAHELVERGFEVTVYERNALGRQGAQHPGARAPARGGRRDLPGEHGFRFFPGFYHHVPDTMRRIPFAGQRQRRVGQPRRAATSGKFLRAGDRPTAPSSGIGPDPQRPADASTACGATSSTSCRRRRRPAARAGLLRRAAARLPHQLRRAALRPVGERQLVGLRRAESQSEEYQKVARRRPDAQPRRRQGDGRQHPHDRQHGRGVRLQHHGPRATTARSTACSTCRPTRRGSTRGSRTCASSACGSSIGRRSTALEIERRPDRVAVRLRRRARAPHAHRGRLVRLRDAGRARAASSGRRPVRRARPAPEAMDDLFTDWMVGHPVLPASAGRHHARATSPSSTRRGR